MNVGELRRRLGSLPNNMEVIIEGESSQGGIADIQVCDLKEKGRKEGDELYYNENEIAEVLAPMEVERLEKPVLKISMDF